jgi:hypothetical protein
MTIARSHTPLKTLNGFALIPEEAGNLGWG